jgi:cell division protein FtsZ
VGGAGGNVVNHMSICGVQGVEFICANTDAQALARSYAHKTIPLGRSGLGTGSRPDLGRAAATETEDAIRAAIEGASMLFITAGMGGGTGTGAAPVIARIAKDMGILTVGFVTLPFDFEGEHRLSKAESGLIELQAHVDFLIVIHNETVLAILGDELTQDEFFSHINDQLKSAMVGMADAITVPNSVNANFEDVHTIMSELGKNIMGTALASGRECQDFCMQGSSRA